MRSRAQSKARLSSFLRALPAWGRSGSVGRAPAANRLISLATAKLQPAPFLDEGGSAGASPSLHTTGCSIGDERHEQNEIYASTGNEAEARGCATLRINGTGSRAVPWFEGAHPLRRCAPVFESAHLGKPRRFLRRCAPSSKVRTKTAHLRRTPRRGRLLRSPNSLTMAV